MHPSDFLQSRIKKFSLKPATLISGSEEYWKALHIKAILNSLFHDKSEILMNYFSYDAVESGIEDFISEANALGFFGQKKIVHLKNTEKLNAEEQKELINYLDSPNPDTFMLLECIALDGRSSLSKHHLLKSEKVDYEIKSSKDLEDFIKFKLKQLGDIKCNAQLKQHLLELFPNNLRLLTKNLEKLAAHNNYVSPLTMENSKVLNAVQNEPNNFEFADALIQKKLKKALHLYSAISRQKDSIFMLIGLIRWQFQSFVKAKQLVENNTSENEIMKTCKIPPFKRKPFFENLGKLTKNELNRKYQKIAKTDYLLKSSPVSQNHLFEMLIYDLCK